MGEDRRLEVFHVPKAVGHVLDGLALAVEPRTHRVGDPMLAVGQDVRQVPLERSGGVSDGCQAARGRSSTSAARNGEQPPGRRSATTGATSP